jgi:Leucine-rich repeat (LRR) protein
MMKQAAASRPSQYDEAPVVPTDSFDFGLDDQFNQKGDPQKGLLRKRIDAARTDGRLNIAAMGLKAIPAEVMGMYNLDNINGTAGSWAESVDLTRFIAADNELESLGDDVFPDVNAQDLADNDDGQSNIFGGLETLDLHGNLLSSIPMGLRQLALLSTLNLSNNKLDNVAFGVISQMTGLRDLKIANNQLTGELDPGLLRLIDLEVLDLHNNQLSSLPSGISELSRLRILNLSQNSFTSLPFDELQQLPLVEFSAAKNKLSGVLINLPSVTLPRLEEFDVSVNSLTALSSGTLELPACKQIILLANRLKELPDMSSWTSLITLSVSDNGLTALPEGFTSMSKLRIADFQGNDIRLLDDRIALMESLETLIVAGNPLREKKFAGMSTADLKKNLLARLEPEPETEPEVEDQPAGTLSTMDNRESWHSAKSDATEYLDAPSTPTLPRSPSAAEWSINTAQGILDRSHSQSSTLNPLVVAQIASENRIINVQLHHNAFAEIPSSVAFFGLTLTTLNLSHNSLSSDTWIREEIELPVLKELNVSSNTFNSLSPLVKSLKAPALEKLDISFNRVSSLPSLRPNFPQLSYLLASNNQIRELAAETVNGMRVVDCSSNELERLDPRLGLCKGLERLEVSGNRFRVPKYTVLEKGTEAVLAWLRDRLPPEEVAALGAEEVF